MKKNLFFIAAFCLVLMSSCVTPFQVFETESTDVQLYEDDVLAFENEDLAIAYDFWTYGGVVLFNVYNKTDSTVFIDFSESGFIINEETISYHEKTPRAFERSRDKIPSVQELPPNKSMNVEGFPIADRWHRGIEKHGSRTYGEADSPLKFSNFINYSFDEFEEDNRTINNDFWVSSIQRVRRSDFKNIDKLEPNRANKFYVSRGESMEQDPTFFWIQVGLDILQILFYL